jgi:ATP-dependent Clp protease protease subunit
VGLSPQDFRGRVVYILFAAEITPNTQETLTSALGTCVNAGAAEIYLAVSTPGGNVGNGIALYNFMRSLPIKITTHNTGNVNSIGNVIFLAGQERYAVPYSTFMFHGVGFDVQRGDRFEERNLREGLQGILADQNRIGSIIEERTNLNSRQVKQLFRFAQTKDTTYAAKVGIIHELREFKIPSGSPVVSFVFQR